MKQNLHQPQLGLMVLWAAILSSAAPVDKPQRPPSIRIEVDPRVELLSIIFGLAGSPEYNLGKVDSFCEDVDHWLGEFRKHAVVSLVAELRDEAGFSHDSPMSLAVHLLDTTRLSTLPLEPWPTELDPRWSREGVARFLTAAQKFLREARFQQFLDRHRALFRETESKTLQFIARDMHLDWFGEYFGPRQTGFVLTLAMLNRRFCYGARVRAESGQEVYCLLGIRQSDSRGQPVSAEKLFGTVVHEFTHALIDPVIEKRLRELEPAGDALYRRAGAWMRAQGYGDARTVLSESLVGAWVLRDTGRYHGSSEAARATPNQIGRDFAWIEDVTNQLAEYETQRGQHPDLEAFAPCLVKFFRDYTNNLISRRKAMAATGPTVISITPQNGATDVDPAQSTITVVFNRPMQADGWLVVAGGKTIPEAVGKPSFETQRRTWFVRVKLKPKRAHEFSLNPEGFDKLRSEEGVPLEPALIQLTTSKVWIEGSSTRTE